VEIFNPEFKHDPGDYSLEEELFVRKELGLWELKKDLFIYLKKAIE
jgi:hypothetical protein